MPMSFNALNVNCYSVSAKKIVKTISRHFLRTVLIIQFLKTVSIKLYTITCMQQVPVPILDWVFSICSLNQRCSSVNWQ